MEAAHEGRTIPMTVSRTTPSWLAAILACPACQGALALSPERIVCQKCGVAFEQHNARVVDLLSRDFRDDNDARWRARQEEMTRSYEELLEDREHVILGYRNDYTPCAPLLGKYSGTVLDLGGGNGITRHFLKPGVDYVVVEPSVEWLDARWQTLATEFPCLAEPLDFVRAVAEKLPFRDEAFDAVLLLWSLNHVSVPRQALREVARVLRPRGRVLIVLEDMPPRWSDFLRGGYPHDRAELGREVVRKIRSLILGWPLQPDHIRIRERPLLRWAAPDLHVELRAWLGAYLTFELVKEEASWQRRAREAKAGDRRIARRASA